MTRRLAWLLPCLLLTACKGGGSPAPAAATPNVSPEGIYVGTLSSTAQGATYNVIGMVAESGTLELINTSNNSQYGGSIGITSASAQTGTLLAYTTAGAYSTQGPLQVTVTPGSSLSGIYSLANGDGGKLGLVYQARYAVPQSLAAIAATYKWTSPRNNGTSTITLDNTGAVTGVNELGCTFTGTVTIPNASYNLYALTLTYGSGSSSGCGSAAGTTLSGLAYYSQATNGTPATPATFTLAATNASSGFYGVYQRQ